MSGGGARVRPARAGDEAAVAALAAALNAEEDHPRTGLFTPEVVARDFLGPHPAGLLLVAETPGDAALVGYATAHATYETNYAERGLYVGDLYVDPAHRRRGVARALIAALAAAGAREGRSHLWWTAKPGNAAAHAFYRRLGGRGEAVMAFACVYDDFARMAAEGRAETQA
jgi:ribosomal protein S18 acetylase RimI-like enzyme